MATRQGNGGVGRDQGTAVGVDAQPGGRREREGRRQGIIKNMNEERLANALGWFSIGLGLAQLAAPRGMARLVGASDDAGSRTVMRALGLREITTGVGILTRPRPAGWVWTRVAGDVMDLALLGSLLKPDNTQRNRTAAATAAVLGVTALDVLCGQQLSRGPGSAAVSAPKERAIRVTKAITINRSPEEVYQFWHDFQNLPRFMEHLESVHVIDEKRSHWVAKAPAGTKVEWDAETIDDRPNELIAWRSLPGADVDNSGSVRFRPAPGGRGTEVRVEMQYEPPGGVIGSTIAKLFGEEPGQQVQEDLRRFKQVMETGEIVHSEASIHRGPHPAQPPADTTSRR